MVWLEIARFRLAVNCANTGFSDVTALQRGSSKYLTDQDTHFSQKR